MTRELFYHTFCQKVLTLWTLLITILCFTGLYLAGYFITLSSYIALCCKRKIKPPIWDYGLCKKDQGAVRKQLREMPSLPCQHRALGSFSEVVLCLFSGGSLGSTCAKNPDAQVPTYVTPPVYIYFFPTDIWEVLGYYGIWCIFQMLLFN